MTDQERYKIISEEFADLIVQNDEPFIHADIPYSINRINNQYSTIFIPVSYMTYDSVNRYSYAAIPKCYGLLSSGNMDETSATALRALENNDLTGEGVLVGIIDTGIDYINPLFLNESQTTRIASIWDQTIESDRFPPGLFYGTEYTRDQINQALGSDDPYAIVPSIDEIGHGTMLAGIAGGYDSNNSEFSGVATKAEFVVVKLKPAKVYLKEFFCIPNSAICYQENDIMMAICYLKQVATNLKRPMVICLGIGTSQGAHMGQCVLCDYLRDMNSTTGYSVVVGAGNEGNTGHHFYGEIDPSIGLQDVEVMVGSEEYGLSMELWGDSPNLYGAEVTAPDGTLLAVIPPSDIQQNTVHIEYEGMVINIDNNIKESRVGDNFILFRICNPMEGLWNFRIVSFGNLPMTYHIWLPMEKFITNTYFINANPFTTLAVPANVELLLSITAYDPIDLTLYDNASRGFTKDNIPKPNVAAPGVHIYAPSIGGAYINASGTGIATAYGVGTVAIFLQWGLILGNLPEMNGIDVNRLLIQGAYRFPDLDYPNPEWGYGILDLENTLSRSVYEIPR